MPNTLTPVLGLELPAYRDSLWNYPFVVDMTLIDTAIGALQTAVASGGGGGGTTIWKKFTLNLSGTDWFVNGIDVGARSASLATQQIPLFTSSARQVFHASLIKHSIAFAGGAISAITVSVGSAAIADALMTVSGDTLDVLQTPSDSRFYLAGGAKMLSAAATGIVLSISCIGGLPSAITAGTLEVDLLCSTLP